MSDDKKLLVKYTGTADRKVIYGNETFGGRLPNGIGRNLVWSWRGNQHILDCSDLSEEATKLLLGEPDMLDVSDMERVPLGGFQRTFLAMTEPEEEQGRLNKHLPIGYVDVGLDEADVYSETGLPPDVKSVTTPVPPEPSEDTVAVVNPDYVDHAPHEDDEARLAAQAAADREARLALYDGKPAERDDKAEWAEFASKLPGLELPPEATKKEIMDEVNSVEEADVAAAAEEASGDGGGAAS